jgi:hypothetical protein
VSPSLEYRYFCIFISVLVVSPTIFSGEPGRAGCFGTLAALLEAHVSRALDIDDLG